MWMRTIFFVVLGLLFPEEWLVAPKPHTDIANHHPFPHVPKNSTVSTTSSKSRSHTMQNILNRTKNFSHGRFAHMTNASFHNFSFPIRFKLNKTRSVNYTKHAMTTRNHSRVDTDTSGDDDDQVQNCHLFPTSCALLMLHSLIRVNSVVFTFFFFFLFFFSIIRSQTNYYSSRIKGFTSMIKSIHTRRHMALSRTTHG